MRKESEGVSSEMSGHIYFMKDIKSYDICSSMLLLKFFIYCK